MQFTNAEQAFPFPHHKTVRPAEKQPFANIPLSLK